MLTKLAYCSVFLLSRYDYFCGDYIMDSMSLAQRDSLNFHPR